MGVWSDTDTDTDTRPTSQHARTHTLGGMKSTGFFRKIFQVRCRDNSRREACVALLAAALKLTDGTAVKNRRCNPASQRAWHDWIEIHSLKNPQNQCRRTVVGRTSLLLSCCLRYYPATRPWPACRGFSPHSPQGARCGHVREGVAIVLSYGRKFCHRSSFRYCSNR